MSIEQAGFTRDFKAQATQVLMVCGHGRVLLLGTPAKALLRELWLVGLDISVHGFSASGLSPEFHLPFAYESFDTVIYLGGSDSLLEVPLPAVLVQVYRVTRRALILLIDTTRLAGSALKSRRDWEVTCFDGGFRKHPLYYRTNDYVSLEHDGEQLFIPLEKVPAQAFERYPMASLREERDLHMDMLRESGSRSDAHVGRYHFAARFIRPGDRVLDAACGLGYGTHLVRCVTQARSFIGIDASEYGIDYARINFATQDTSFLAGMLPDCLASIADCSVDHVLCFETLEHVQDPVGLLAEFKRVLTPGGRLICSVPHDWSDETGNDPNPYHFHVYDKPRFVGELSRFFDIERLLAQTADRIKQPGGSCVWLKRPRSLNDIETGQSTVEAEWLLAVAMKSPLEGRHVPYVEQVFSIDEQRQAGHALAFARDYSNPWLIRALVATGLRSENGALRRRWAQTVWADPAAGSADRGAALCVLVYAALAETPDTFADGLLGDIEGYLADVANDTNCTVLRWRVSLMYAGGLLALSVGRREMACRFMAEVIAAPVAEYSCTLLTKPAEAAYLVGLLLLAEGRDAEAHQTWWQAFQRITNALAVRLARGYDSAPPTFEIKEMAAALSLCGRLVAATLHGHEQLDRPGVFYDACHADSVFQVQSLMAVETALVSLRRDFLDQQYGVDMLKKGKDWLEAEWKAQAVDLESRQQCIAAQVTQIAELEAALAATQSRNHEAAAEKTCLQFECQRALERVARLGKSLLFKAARKLGFYK